MDDGQLLRYSRHILLDEIGIEGQARFLASHALIVGAGGLGSAAGLYLAAAGVGRITLVDPDKVDATNLQRQIAHTSERVGDPKVLSLATAMHALNPGIRIDTHHSLADPVWLQAQVVRADVVLDCTDNFITRHAINSACVAHRVPLVSGAALQFDGQVSVFDAGDAAAPCYACLFPPASPNPDAKCATMGVFAPLVGVIGAVQAAEALKVLAGIGNPLRGRLLLLDGRAMTWTEMTVPRALDCTVCADRD